MPQERYKNARNLPLNKYGTGPFCKFKIPGRFQMSGVYVLTVDGAPQYVGECANLSARFNAGYGNISPKNCFKGGLLYMALLAGQRMSLWFFQTHDYKSVELMLRGTFRLTWNRI